MYNIKHLFKNVFQCQTAEFHSEKPQLLLHQPNTIISLWEQNFILFIGLFPGPWTVSYT